MDKLTAFQKKYLKSLAHDMNPLVHIGKNALTPDVIKKIDAELNAHELIKVKILDSDILPPKETAAEIEKLTRAHVLRVIGKTIVLFRENPKNKKNPYFKAGGRFGNRKRLHGKKGKSEE
jgi:RNA-binding protein